MIGEKRKRKTLKSNEKEKCAVRVHGVKTLEHKLYRIISNFYLFLFIKYSNYY